MSITNIYEVWLLCSQAFRLKPFPVRPDGFVPHLLFLKIFVFRMIF